MADSAETDKKEEKKEEKPKMTPGIALLLIFSTAAALVILVLLFAGKEPGDAADHVSGSAFSSEYTRAPDREEKNGLTSWIHGKIHTLVLAKNIYDGGARMGEDIQDAVEDIAEAWGNLLRNEKRPVTHAAE